MASKITQLWDNQLVEASALPPLVPGVPQDVLDVNNLDNETGVIYNSLKVTLEYSELNPDAAGATFFLTTLVEFKDISGVFKFLTYQFNPMNKLDAGPLRILVLQPNLDTFNLGIDDIIFPIDRSICRVSRSPGELPQGLFRVRVQLQDNGPQGAKPFVSVKVSGEVEQYNV